MNRPTGVTILGWLAIVFGAFGLLASIGGAIAALAFLGVGAGIAGTGAATSGALFAAGAFLIVALAVWTAILSAIEVVFGVGALQLRPWAWTVGVVWTWVSIVTSVLNIFGTRGGGIFAGLLGIVIALAILYYLYTDEVRMAFGKLDKRAPAFIEPLFLWINRQFTGRGGTPQAPSGPSGPPSSGMPAH
jgi:hypothetical protein